jgi:hypothetical protein
MDRPRETAIAGDRGSVWDKHLGADMFHASVFFPEYPGQYMMRERWMWRAVNCLFWI